MKDKTKDIENKPDSSIAVEGENVTGGPESTENTSQPDNTAPVTSDPEGGEIIPAEESKKDEMTGYNEHPDQEKVGGG